MQYYIPYLYTFPGTNIHWITFLFIIVEALIFSYQAIYWLYRPSDKPRLWYLVFVFLMLMYNIVGGLFVDVKLPIPINLQLDIEVFFVMLVSSYFPYYIYKSLGFKELKFFAVKGSLLFLFLPFVISFVILNQIKDDVEFSLITLALSVMGYSYFYIYKLYRILFIRILKDKTMDQSYRERFIGVTITASLWVVCLTSFAFINIKQYVEHIFTNIGFLIMSYIFIRQSILESRTEYRKLLKSEQELYNINELLQIKVKERTQALEVSNEQRINSFINLAHEIRTPITLVKNYLEEFISKHKESEDIKSIKSNIDKLSNDIVKFFNEEKLIKGLSPQYNHNQIIDLSKLLKHRVMLFKPSANKKSVELSSSIDDDIFLKADPDAMDSLINNLIENAIKYTGADGHINVLLKADGDIVLFSVKDNGCGIPENMHQQIFEPYIQVLSGKQHSTGLGIGLYIVSKIVVSLQGEICLKSKENEGSEFLVKLQRYYLSKEDILTNPGPSTKINLWDNEEPNIEDAVDNKQEFSVFLIEDNHEMLRYLRNKLKDRYNVYVATSGRRALEKLKHIPKPDLFISDVMMDEMDGFELLKIIADNPKYNHIPFIFLTAKTTTIDKMQGLTMGAVDYIHKPFSGNELVRKVESIIRNADKQKENILHKAMEVISNNLKNSTAPDDSKEMKFEQNCKIYNLTPREKEIIVHIAEGLTYKEISDKLNISEKTLVTHRQNIFKKVNVGSKMDLINRLFES